MSEPTARRYIIDRLEDEGWAVLERPDGRTFDLPLDLLPPDIEPGDVLHIDSIHGERSTVLILRRDAQAKQERLEQAKARLARLRKRDPGGDIDL